MFYKILELFHRLYVRKYRSESKSLSDRGITDVDKASEAIINLLLANEPCMIARFGSNEIDAVVNYIGVNLLPKSKRSILGYIKSKCPEWWWSLRTMSNMKNQAGFFPSNADSLSKFAKLMLEDSRQLDMLGSWRTKEDYLNNIFSPNLIMCDREKLNPFFAKRPWTQALKGKKVLIVHPFVKSIYQQYSIKDKLFPTPILPDFELKVMPAVQSIGGNPNFDSWFEALAFMKSEMDRIDYDIVLLGCGAYGFPLAAHAKRMGKKAIHIGGSLQLFFGIKGKRWESSGYKGGPNDYSIFFNDFWVRPSDDETPKSAKGVEGGCYW